ncbi:MAG: hypothetical protein AAGC88_05440 [Bacteroidota bacterium]
MKANEFDKKIKEQVKQVENTKPKFTKWDIDRSWDKLSQMLKQASPKSLVWYFSLAASVSMVMANTQLMQDIWEPIEDELIAEPKYTDISSKLIEESDIKSTIRLSSNIVFVDNIKNRTLTYNTAIPSSTLALNVPYQRTSVSEEKVQNQVNISPRISSSANQSGITLGTELRLLSNKTIGKARLGMSIEAVAGLNRYSRSAEQMVSQPVVGAVYANLVVVNDKSKRPWSASIGSPIIQTPIDNELRPMIKLNYQTRLAPKLYVGPEIIVTRQFSKVYPGITLSFG